MGAGGVSDGAVRLFDHPGRDVRARTELPQVEGEARATEEVVFEPLRAYLVSLGSYATGEEARIEAARNASRGAAGYLVEEGSSTLVLGALYFDAGQARTVADNLAQSEDLDAGVVVREAERVRLRVTATGAQIDCLRSTQAELCQTAAQMADLALQLDRAETDAKSARTLLNVAAARLEDRERALRSIPAPSKIRSVPACWRWWNSFAPLFLCYRAKIQRAPFPFREKSSIMSLKPPCPTSAISGI